MITACLMGLGGQLVASGASLNGEGPNETLVLSSLFEGRGVEAGESPGLAHGAGSPLQRA